MVTAQRPRPTTLPLESGDRLTRAEFERRYRDRPEIKKAELIEGVVYVASPVSLPGHAEPHADVVWWLTSYRRRHPGCRVADNGTVRLDEQNEPQPDAMMFRDVPGQRVDADGYLAGAPDLVVEVAASSASYDLGAKKAAYERNGVHEYIVWQIHEERIDWFRLQEGRYQVVEPAAGGVVESDRFPGLRLDIPAMLRGDLDAVESALR